MNIGLDGRCDRAAAPAQVSGAELRVGWRFLPRGTVAFGFPLGFAPRTTRITADFTI